MKPVCYAIKSNGDGSLGNTIAVCNWITFDKELKKLSDGPWVKKGKAKIVPLYEISEIEAQIRRAIDLAIEGTQDAAYAANYHGDELIEVIFNNIDRDAIVRKILEGTNETE